MATTPNGLPYPVGTDKVVDGDDAIKALALALDSWAPVKHRAAVILSGRAGFSSASLPAGTNAAVILGPSTITLAVPSHVRFEFWFAVKAASTFGALAQLVLDGANPGGTTSSVRAVNSQGLAGTLDASFGYEADLAAGAHPWSVALSVDPGSGAVSTGGFGSFQIIATPL